MTDPRVLSIPCGCSAWRMGGAEGFVPCRWHVLAHLLRPDGWSGDDPCDCLRCRARARGLSPFDLCAELHEHERLGRNGPATMPDDQGIDHCGCAWERRAGRWTLTARCARHQSLSEVDVKLAEQRRNA